MTLTPYNDNRDFSTVSDKTAISYLIKEYLNNKEVFIKNDLGKKISADLEFDESKKIVKLKFPHLPPLGLIKDNISIFVIEKRYIEVRLKKGSFSSRKGEFSLIDAKIALKIRNVPRINVLYDNISANNLRLSKYTIEPGITKAPICCQVAFDSIKEEIVKEFPDIKFGIISEKIENKAILASMLKKEILYIINTKDETAYRGMGKYLDYRELLGNRFEREQTKLIESRISSLLVYPVIYTNTKGETVSVGYLYLDSKTSGIPRNVIPQLKKYADEIIEHIRDANINIIQEKQSVINVSKGGIQIELNNPETIEILKSHGNEVVFEVHADRLTFILYGKIVHIFLDHEKSYIIGLQLLGGEKKRGIDFWEKFIDKLFKERQNDLITSPFE